MSDNDDYMREVERARAIVADTHRRTAILLKMAEGVKTDELEGFVLVSIKWRDKQISRNAQGMTQTTNL